MSQKKLDKDVVQSAIVEAFEKVPEEDLIDLVALIYAMTAILIYVAFRFDLKFGPGALVAMVHDVIMVAGYYLVSRREFNLTSIAVLLTILGYSIKDTIVIYDRIREEMARYKGKPLPEIINFAVSDTLSRTILTGGVTSLSLVGLLIFGVGEIFDFAAGCWSASSSARTPRCTSRAR